MHMTIINYKSTKMNTKTHTSKNSKDYKSRTNSEKSNFLALMIKLVTNIENVQKSGWTWINYCFW